MSADVVWALDHRSARAASRNFMIKLLVSRGRVAVAGGGGDVRQVRNLQGGRVRLQEGRDGYAPSRRWSVEALPRGEQEYALVILGGKCTVEGDDFRFENVGKRKDVFDGPATCVYVPRNTPFTVTAVGEVSIAVSKSPATKDFAPALDEPRGRRDKEPRQARLGARGALHPRRPHRRGDALYRRGVRQGRSVGKLPAAQA